MKKYFRTFLLVLILSGIVSPFFLVRANPVTAQDDELHFRHSVATTVLDWDPASFNPSTGDSYRYACLENMVTMKADWDGFNIEDNYTSGLIPVLATSWDVEPWPSEMNQAPVPFVNSGGVKAINWTLRENVTFHDGSIWNATVAKWNYDRIFIITGNLTGRGDTQMRDDYWININELEPFFTPSWNLSWAKGKMGSYDGMVAPGTALYESVPLVNNTQVIDPGDPVTGGGILRVEFNDWSTFWVYDLSHVNPGAYNLIISMETYKDDYTDQTFHGYDAKDGVAALVGTGPYIYGGHVPTGPASGGLLTKNYNYWNRTGL
ncbi:MAG: hypothetical protein ACFE94_08160, partial [Candidatus Hodarchaeota archaeon]